VSFFFCGFGASGLWMLLLSSFAMLFLHFSQKRPDKMAAPHFSQ
jgi:hypothetical protein